MRRADVVLAQIVGQGAMPLVIGGDDSIPPIVARALASRGTRFDVVTIDAHLDFRDEIGGSRTAELEEARAAGHRLITAAEAHDHGQRWLCDQLPAGGDVFVSIDIDGLDPSVAPGTGWPQPGGLTFRHVAGVIAELAPRARSWAATSSSCCRPAT